MFKLKKSDFIANVWTFYLLISAAHEKFGRFVFTSESEGKSLRNNARVAVRKIVFFCLELVHLSEISYKLSLPIDFSQHLFPSFVPDSDRPVGLFFKPPRLLRMEIQRALLSFFFEALSIL